MLISDISMPVQIEFLQINFGFNDIYAEKILISESLTQTNHQKLISVPHKIFGENIRLRLSVLEFERISHSSTKLAENQVEAFGRK